MFSPKDIIEALASNVKKTRSPFGIPKFMVNKWWKKMSLRWEGEYLLFTGMMYQFMPYIERTTHYLEGFEDTKMASLLRFGKYQPRWVSGIGLALMTSGKEKKRSDEIIRTIASLLVRSGVDFYYKSKLDEYSGILLYDMGDQENFEKHARYVADKLKRAGVRKIITVDPHTTYALKVLYPKYIGASFEVKTYFEMLNLPSTNGKGEQVTLHDPCFYGRYLELSDVPRHVLSNLGVECVEVRNRGLFTICCGGPAESLSPKLSKEVLDRRMEELSSTGKPLVAMCPICLGNLKKADPDVQDLSIVIARNLVES